MVFLFKVKKYSGEIVSSSEGEVFWVEKNDVLKLPWIWHMEIWHMDEIMKILADGEYAKLYLDTTDNWKPVLK